jgi:hypothetical protein
MTSTRAVAFAGSAGGKELHLCDSIYTRSPKADCWADNTVGTRVELKDGQKADWLGMTVDKKFGYAIVFYSIP